MFGEWCIFEVGEHCVKLAAQALKGCHIISMHQGSWAQSLGYFSCYNCIYNCVFVFSIVVRFRLQNVIIWRVPCISLNCVSDSYGWVAEWIAESSQAIALHNTKSWRGTYLNLPSEFSVLRMEFVNLKRKLFIRMTIFVFVKASNFCFKHFFDLLYVYQNKIRHSFMSLNNAWKMTHVTFLLPNNF
jgi:hypothetical protein